MPREAVSLRHRVEGFLRKAIASGQFEAGQKLIERELCELTGVSRPSIREALRRLEAEGLIDIVPHRGPTVASIGVEEARQLYAVRALLEGYAAQEFARLATVEQIRQLEDAFADLETAARPRSRRSLADAKAAFYGVLLAGCRNDIVANVLAGLHNRVNVLRMTSMSRKDRLPTSMTEIREILARIMARDPDGAREASIAHVENAARVALDVLARREMDAALPPAGKARRAIGRKPG
jgi:DNA-binding GntR family transcriptional regulator